MMLWLFVKVRLVYERLSLRQFHHFLNLMSYVNFRNQFYWCGVVITQYSLWCNG